MGKLFTIDAATKATITDALDDIISEFGKDCRLVYPARWVRCENCLWDAASGRSTNHWRSGGPLPFNGGPCPLCKGNGQKAQETSEVVRFKCEWDPRKFLYPVPGVDLRVRYSVCETKGYMTDLPRVTRCDHMVVQAPVEGIVRSKMKLASDPISPGNIIQGRYWVAKWEAKG